MAQRKPLPGHTWQFPGHRAAPKYPPRTPAYQQEGFQEHLANVSFWLSLLLGWQVLQIQGKLWVVQEGKGQRRAQGRVAHESCCPAPPEKAPTFHLVLRELLGAGQGQEKEGQEVHLLAQQPLVVP